MRRAESTVEGWSRPAPVTAPTAPEDPFNAWFAALEARHRASLSFQEVRRSLQALSSVYVERRSKLIDGGALDGAGKRAAFALYYGARHFLLVREVVRALGATKPTLPRVADLGCGTGVAGVAWALEMAPRPEILSVDRSRWALSETRWTLAQLGLRGRATPGDVLDTKVAPGACGIVLAFSINELDDPVRDALLPRLLESAKAGARVLILEPLAKKASPWWPAWSKAFKAAGGRDDEWKFRPPMPETLELLGKAAGLESRELTARTLYLAPAAKR